MYVDEADGSTEQKQPDYEMMKEVFKKRLISLYMETVVKVSALPLHLERNDATINDLYVTPWLKLDNNSCNVFKTKTSPEVAPGNERSRIISFFYDIFYKDGQLMKLIYIIGEAGSGKSAFCKKMIHKWCLSNFEQSEVCSNSQRKCFATDVVMSDEEIMKSYEFLFYISLRHNTDTGDIRTMLNNHYEDPALDVILERESRNCLILIDGLDEWKPPAEEKLSQFQTIGLPKRDLSKQYTTITTSRPWKVDILKIKESEIDNKIRLCGIEYKSVIKMTTYIVSYLNKIFKKKKSANRFLAKYVLSNEQNKTPLNDIMKSPVMLQQLVCLWFDDKLHQSSRRNIYTSMLELSLEWSVQRKPDDRIFEMFREKSMDLEEISLPLTFDEDSICEEYKYILLIAGKVAYHTLFSEQKESSLTFGQATLRKYGANKDFIQCCLEMGIFTEEQNVTFSLSKRRNTQLSFTHKSIQEVLAAIYIVMQCESVESDAMSQTVSEYLRNVKTAEDILEQSDVIELVCGFNPSLTADVSKYMYDIVIRDERFIEFRETLKQWPDCNIIVQIQELVFGCIKEFQSSKCCEGYDLYLADAIIRDKSDIPLLKNIKKENILSITIAGEIWGLSRSSIHLSDCDVRILCSTISQCSSSLYRFSKLDSITADPAEELPVYSTLVSCKYNHLQALELKDIRWKHDKMFGLSSFLEQNTNLQVLSLRDMHCEADQCTVHEANLSKHVKLRSMDISDADIRLTGLNSENLTRFVLIGMDKYGSIDHLLSGAKVLEYINLSSWTFHSDSKTFISDMQKLKYIEMSEVQMSETTWLMFTDSLKTFPSLQKLTLRAVNIPDRVKITLLNTLQGVGQIERLDLMDMNISIKFPKGLCNLKHLVVNNVKCFETDICDFVNSLQYLCTLERLVFKNMDIQSSSFTFPPSLVCLKHILLQNVILTKEAWIEFALSLHHLQQLEILEFQSLNIPDASLSFSSEMKNLRNVSFEKVLMSISSWKDIADSLSLLRQSIEVETVDLYIEHGSLETAIEYVKKKKDLFQVSLRFGVDCSFRTKKSSSAK
ncbi:uncharacterized protein LOC123563372 isoform X3 [Mercenaria mercenaria]|nr:uncharacterized protein LOC123563372 isoform X3 [Mercenaria mercenaria]